MVDAAMPEPRIPFEESFDARIGLQIDESDEIGILRGRLAVVPGVCQPMGLVHGGVYAAIAESLASRGTGIAVHADGKRVMGMSNNTAFLRPVTEGAVHATAAAFHRGRTTWVWDVEMRNDDGKLCATSRVTIAVR